MIAKLQKKTNRQGTPKGVKQLYMELNRINMIVDHNTVILRIKNKRSENITDICMNEIKISKSEKKIYITVSVWKILKWER